MMPTNAYTSQWFLHIYRFNETIQRIEISMDDISRMKISLKHIVPQIMIANNFTTKISLTLIINSISAISSFPHDQNNMQDDLTV